MGLQVQKWVISHNENYTTGRTGFSKPHLQMHKNVLGSRYKFLLTATAPGKGLSANCRFTSPQVIHNKLRVNWVKVSYQDRSRQPQSKSN